MKRITVHCDFCGCGFAKPWFEVYTHNFCCRNHFNQWNSKRLTQYNRSENPLNKPGQPIERRLRLGDKLRNSGAGRTYRKWCGRHEHRVIAEALLGRKLKPDEVVHHIDENKRNNSPENLKVMDKKEHAKLHSLARARKRQQEEGRDVL